jgi:hypothetical protein
MPKRTSDCEDQISTARQMPANWRSGTDATPLDGDCATAAQPAPAHPGAPAKLPGYGK